MPLLFVSALLFGQDQSTSPRELSPGGTELKEAFRKAKGQVRLLLLVSPG
jgi:hypothetical protein